MSDQITQILDDFREAIEDANQLSRERSMEAIEVAYTDAIEALEELGSTAR